MILGLLIGLHLDYKELYQMFVKDANFILLIYFQNCLLLWRSLHVQEMLINSLYYCKQWHFIFLLGTSYREAFIFALIQVHGNEICLHCMWFLYIAYCWWESIFAIQYFIRLFCMGFHIRKSADLLCHILVIDCHISIWWIKYDPRTKVHVHVHINV